MTNDLWQIVLLRLEETGLRGFCQLNVFNELSLVKHGACLVWDLRHIGWRVRILTNGDDPEAIQSWLNSGADQVLVTLHAPISSGQGETRRQFASDPRVAIRTLVKLDNRAGYIPAPAGWAPMQRCFAPDMLTVRVKGDVSLCCLDYAAETNFGNIRDQSIAHIFQTQRYQTVRRLLSAGRPAHSLCRNCLASL